MISIILTVLISLAWLYKILSPSRRLKRMGDKIPGPKSWPVVGNGLLFRKRNQILQTLIELQRKYGPVLRLWYGKHLVISLSDADDIKALLSSTIHLNKGLTYRILDSWIGSQNVLSGDVHVWRSHRLALNPSFSLRALRTYLPIIEKHSTILNEQLANKVDGEEFDLQPYVERCSLDILCEAVMGLKLEKQTSEDSPYLRAITNMNEIYLIRLTSPWLHNERIFSLTSLGKAFNAEAKFVGDYIRQIISERQVVLGAASDTEDEGAVQKQEKRLLDHMLLDTNFTNEEIISETQAFLLAGHGTLMFTISFCIFELSQNPAVQEKAYEEIQEFFSKNNEQEPSYGDYDDGLKYLENVINETLRMHSVAHTVTRYISEDFELPSGFTIPKGAETNCFFYQLHRDERYFSNADQFIPERFETKQNFTDFSFIPFSAGPRNCIGQKFGMLEMKVIILALLQKYEFLPSEKVKTVEVEAGAFLRSLNGFPVRLTSRKQVTP